MIRPLTCICMLLAGGSGLYLYQSKHRAQMLDREIERTLKATDTVRDRIGVLRGEWALLNEPERLAGLAQSHLGLRTLMPGQFVTAGELGSRLPPVVVPGAVHVPGEDEISVAAGSIPPSPSLAPISTSAPAIPARPVAGTAKAPPVPPATPSRMPAQVASASQALSSPLPPPRPGPAPPVLAPVVSVSASPIVAAPPVKPVQPRPAASPSASAVQVAASARPTAPAPAGTSIGESVMRTARLLSGGQQGAAHTANAVGPAPQPAANPPAYNPPSSSQAITSVLGGSRPVLPPLVPFGSAMAASVASTR